MPVGRLANEPTHNVCTLLIPSIQSRDAGIDNALEIFGNIRVTAGAA
jgi:hypothetical protein